MERAEKSGQHVVDVVLTELPKLDPADERFEAKMKVLSELVEHHADEEKEDDWGSIESSRGKTLLGSATP
jgi:hypothetical protein